MQRTTWLSSRSWGRGSPTRHNMDTRRRLPAEVGGTIRVRVAVSRVDADLVAGRVPVVDPGLLVLGVIDGLIDVHVDVPDLDVWSSIADLRSVILADFRTILADVGVVGLVLRYQAAFFPLPGRLMSGPGRLGSLLPRKSLSWSRRRRHRSRGCLRADWEHCQHRVGPAVGLGPLLWSPGRWNLSGPLPPAGRAFGARRGAVHRPPSFPVGRLAAGAVPACLLASAAWPADGTSPAQCSLVLVHSRPGAPPSGCHRRPAIPAAPLVAARRR